MLVFIKKILCRRNRGALAGIRVIIKMNVVYYRLRFEDLARVADSSATCDSLRFKKAQPIGGIRFSSFEKTGNVK